MYIEVNKKPNGKYEVVPNIIPRFIICLFHMNTVHI